MKKSVLYSILAILVFTSFFYFYPTELFGADIKEFGAEFTKDISLKAFFDYTALPNGVVTDRIVSVTPTYKGWFLLIICIVGTPIMLGYRIATNKKGARENQN